MKIAILNDTHCGIRNSSEIFIEYQERFYNEIFFPYLKEHNIKNIIHLGDYYEHRKFINFKALNSNRKVFLNRLREDQIRMDIIPGNHDTYYKNTNELNSLKELLGHYMNEVNIIMHPKVIDYDGCKIGLVPWIAPDVQKESQDFLSNCDADIIGGHFELRGFDMYRGITCKEGMDTSSLQRFRLVLSGHFHTKSSRGNIHYLGSQMEFFWNDAHDKKYFHILDTETKEITPVQNPLTLFEKIYYDDSKSIQVDFKELQNKFVKVFVVKKDDLYSFDKFVDKLNSCGLHELKISENINEFLGESVADSDVNIEDTETLIRSYIDAVETGLDKGRIKEQVHHLMLEAQSVQIA